MTFDVARPAPAPFGFAGADTDSTGMIYLIGRYYDPQSGQFLSVDPLVDETGEAYGYAGDDPVDNTDPNGDTPVGPNGQGNGFTCAADTAIGPCYSTPGAFTWGTVEALGVGFAAFALPPVLGLYDAASAASNAYELAQNPCSSDWAIAGQSLSAAFNAAGALGLPPSLGEGASLGADAAAEEGAASSAADAAASGRTFEDVLNSENNRTFTRYLQSLQSRAAQTGESPLTAEQTQELWDSAMERGFTAPRGVEEEWVGGLHINLYGPGGGPNIHFPVPPGWTP